MVYSPAFSALYELILSHNARIAPSNKLINSSKMQVQNCGIYSFNITKNKEHKMKKKYVKPMTEVTEIECMKPLAMSEPRIKKEDPAAGGVSACNIWGSSRSAVGDNSNGKGLWEK